MVRDGTFLAVNPGTGLGSLSPTHRFFTQLLALSEEVRARLAEVVSDCGLNHCRYELLTAVAARGDAGCSQTELAAALGLAESSVCTHVDKLQKEGLLHRFRSKQDRRRSLLLLSESGRDRLEAAQVAVDELLEGWLMNCRPDEIGRTTALLESLSSIRLTCSSAGEGVRSDIAASARAESSPRPVFREAG